MCSGVQWANRGCRSCCWSQVVLRNLCLIKLRQLGALKAGTREGLHFPINGKEGGSCRCGSGRPNTRGMPGRGWGLGWLWYSQKKLNTRVVEKRSIDWVVCLAWWEHSDHLFRIATGQLWGEPPIWRQTYQLESLQMYFIADRYLWLWVTWSWPHYYAWGKGCHIFLYTAIVGQDPGKVFTARLLLWCPPMWRVSTIVWIFKKRFIIFMCMCVCHYVYICTWIYISTEAWIWTHRCLCAFPHWCWEPNFSAEPSLQSLVVL